jgi:hypothetical protein
MTQQVFNMIKKAREQEGGKAFPLHGSWEKSVTTYNGDIILWFDDSSGSSKVIREKEIV